KANPPRPTAALRLGYVYLRSGNLPLARQALEQCLQLATREDEARTRGIAHADLAILSACEEPELRRWKERPELREVCVAAEAALANTAKDEDPVPVEL